MGVSKVDFAGETLIDLTGDTVNENTLLSGYTAHDKAGQLINGLAVIPTKLSELENDAGYAKTASPVFTGTPKAPTPAESDNSTRIATTNFVKTLISNLVNGAPETLDTLKEIADALGENDEAVQLLNTAIGNKVDKVSGKGLSTNDFTTAEKEKLGGIATGATKNSPSSTVPKAPGTASVGSESAYARGDHVHPAQTSVSGNAGTASKWANGRNVNGLIIDGSSNLANYGTCSTAAATVAKTVSCTGFGLVTGAEITVRFTVTNTAANPTLNANGTGAKPIYYRGDAITAGYLAAGRTYIFRYNGTQYDLVGDVNTNTTYGLATASTRGLVKIGYAENGKNYPVELSNEQMFVNVPWTDNNTWKANTADSEGYVSAGKNHANQVWKTDANGVPGWRADANTTYANFVKSGTGAKAGLVPAPSTTAGATKYLREDGTWQKPPNTTYGAATQSAAGLMSAADKKKIDGVATGANKTSITNNLLATVAGTALDAVQGKALDDKIGEINSKLDQNSYPYGSLDNIRLFGIISKKQNSPQGLTNCYVIFFPTAMSPSLVYGVKTIKDITIQGVKIIRQNGVDANGFQAVNASQTNQGILISYTANFDMSGYICDGVFDFCFV